MKGDEIQMRKKKMFQSKTGKYSNKNKEKKEWQNGRTRRQKKFTTRLRGQALGQKWLEEGLNTTLILVYSHHCFCSLSLHYHTYIFDGFNLMDL